MTAQILDGKALAQQFEEEMREESNQQLLKG